VDGYTDKTLVVMIACVAAFVMSWLVQPHFRSLGFLTHIVDHPGHRRPHREPVPRTGGMAIFISFFCTLFFLERVVLATPLPWQWLAILGGAGLAILALGVGDDRFGIHAEKKLYGQIVVIMGLMLFDQRLDTVMLPLIGPVSLGGWAWPITLFWYLGFINSMNLIDGLDGLASGLSIVAALTLVAISWAVQEYYTMLFAATLSGATLAFFYWNISRRKIFLGDSGSMWMGLVIGSLILNLSQQVGVSLPVLLAPMVVPIWDTATTIVRRYRNRVSIFQADDYHLHHRMIRLGFSPRSAVLCLLLITAGTSLFALSDFLSVAWLGLPALAFCLWAAQLGAAQHMRNRGVGLDIFTELSYAVGLENRLDEMSGLHGRNVAEVIDLHAERQYQESAALHGQDGAAVLGSVVAHPAAATDSAPRPGADLETGGEDAVYSPTKDVS
jgi:UDP-GlcNAc:undecaprenyl-phosphate GlcNAc-1-phosphate transferase